MGFRDFKVYSAPDPSTGRRCNVSVVLLRAGERNLRLWRTLDGGGSERALVDPEDCSSVKCSG